MKKFIVYNSDGKILRRGSCPLSTFGQQAKPGEFIIEGEANDATDFIEGGLVKSKGLKPSESHVFDHASKNWVEDAVLKAQLARSEKRSGRNQTISQGYTYNGDVFQIDASSRANIAGKTVYLQERPLVLTVNWKALDNTVVSFTRAEFIDFACAVSDYYENIVLTS
ncbi:MAG: DUF4376 domain-containing protein [Thiomicrorhabdus sp.]|jgi:hypothetical protein|nr:DUF4376 domain-containing protein [Thiomicrorhabdus sp.]